MALSARTPTQRPATLRDFLAIPEYDRFHEILEGQLVRKAMPTGSHGSVQRRLSALLDGYDEGSARKQPGGWWLATEADILLPGEQPVRPDLAGWRCERLSGFSFEPLIRIMPDWVCEVVSPGDARRDTVIKRRDYARAGIPYYWLVDLRQRSLVALQLSGEHYAVQSEVREGSPQRQVQPFELVEIAMETLFQGIARVEESRLPPEPGI